jgi:hypothetical protein
MLSGRSVGYTKKWTLGRNCKDRPLRRLQILPLDPLAMTMPSSSARCRSRINAADWSDLVAH